MLPLAGGLMSGAASLLGGFMSSQTSAANTQANIAAQEQMQMQTENFNAGQAQLARDYTTQMSNTAYQRASADMVKAGLNPMMMFGSGGPASTPSSPSPAVGTPNMALSQRTSPLAGVGDAVNRALSSAIEAKTLDKMTDEISNLQATRKQIEATTLSEAKRPAQIAAQTGFTEELAKSQRQEQTLKGPATVEAAGVLGLPDWLVKSAGVAKYGAQGVGDIVAPAVSSALRLKGLGMLRKEFDAQEAARAAH